MDKVSEAVGVVADTVGAVAETVGAVAEKAIGVAGKVVGADRALPLPGTREELLALHDVARRKRDAASLGSHDRVEAAFEIERIEIQIARIERAMDPPLV